MLFSYRVLDASGAVRQGAIEASCEADALELLREKGQIPLELKAQTVAENHRKVISGAQKIRHTDVVAFVRELATLLKSGVGLSDAFSTLLETTDHPRMKESLLRLNTAVLAGEHFSAALEKSDFGLPQYVHALARAGEATGDLGNALARSADQLEFEEKMKNEAREALTYPMILVFTGIVAISFIFAFVVPRFAGMFQGRKVDLPLLSQWVLGTGVYVHDHWVGVLFGFAGVAVGAYLLFRSRAARQHMARVSARLPIMSGWIAGAETTRWTSMLAVLVQSKVPILMCMDLAALSVLLPENANRLRSVQDDVRRGKRLSSAIEERRLLEGASLTMLKVGEKSGQLGAMLEHVASYASDKHRALQRSVVALIEPVSILVIGLVLGVVMVGVVMAMTSLTEIKL